MSPLRRRLVAQVITVLLAAAQALLPPRHAAWARAMRAEVLALGDSPDALPFAWGCLCAALRLAVRARLANMRQPDSLGLACASAVVALGCAFMATREAPSGYAWVNGLSLAVAWASFRLLPRARLQQDAHWRSVTTLALGALLLWAALPGPGPNAADGWLRLGPLPVQPIWLLCPAWWTVSAPLGRTTRHPPGARALGAAGLLMGLFALAAQAQAPLLALTAMLLAVRAMRARSAIEAVLALLAVGLTQAAMACWTAPPPSPFVDEVLQLAFTHNAVWGALMTAVWLTLLLPGALHRRAREHGLTWAALLVLALPGWLPAPVLGFGGSFIVGYLLSLAALPGSRPAPPPEPLTPADRPPARDAPPLPRARLA